MGDPIGQFTPEAILTQLERISQGDDFANAKSLRQFLRFVVTETLAGREDQIKEYTIAVKALGRGVDFDPALSPIVRIQAGRLRRALGDYYAGEGEEDPIRFEIPKGAYVPVFYEAASSQATPASEVGAVSDDRTLAFSGPSLAVLPFLDLGGDATDAYFVDGLGEELSINLARFQELSVIAYYSSRQLRGGGVREAGRRLGVDYTVTGSVRRTPERLRVTAGLSHTGTAEQIWAQRFDRALTADNLFSLQDEIVQHIVAAVGSSYGVVLRDVAKASQQKQTHDLNVYEAFFRFYKYQRNPSPAAHVAAREALERAVTIDPEHALAWAALGEVYVDAYVFAFSAMDNALDQAHMCAAKAIQLDPLCQHAHHVMAYVSLQMGDTRDVIDACERVLGLNPNNAYLVGTAGFWLVLVGEYERGLATMRHAIRLNPYYPGWFHHAFFLDYYRRGEYALALTEAQEFNEPDFFWDPLDRSIALSALGRTREARQALNAVLRLQPDFAQHPRRYLKAFVPTDDLLEQMLADLSKAGLAFEAAAT
jgi:TolB-like protein